jgi:hypothetical protein
MSTAVFTPCEGGIAKVRLCTGPGSGSAGTFNVTVDGAKIGFPTTGFILEMQGNFQFLHSLDQFIYYYNFGDRVGELTVSGMGFVGGNCGVSRGGNNGDICGIYDLYSSKRQSVSKKAMQVGADKCGTFWAFLTGMRIEMSQHSSGVPLGQWSLRFHVIPPRAA